MSEKPADDVQITMTRGELRAVITEAVDETLVRLGIEPQDHKEMQADMLFLRTLRTTHETVKRRAVITLVGLVLTGSIGLLVMALREWFIGGTR